MLFPFRFGIITCVFILKQLFASGSVIIGEYSSRLRLGEYSPIITSPSANNCQVSAVSDFSANTLVTSIVSARLPLPPVTPCAINYGRRSSRKENLDSHCADLPGQSQCPCLSERQVNPSLHRDNETTRSELGLHL